MTEPRPPKRPGMSTAHAEFLQLEAHRIDRERKALADRYREHLLEELIEELARAAPKVAGRNLWLLVMAAEKMRIELPSIAKRKRAANDARNRVDQLAAELADALEAERRALRDLGARMVVDDDWAAPSMPPARAGAHETALDLVTTVALSQRKWQSAPVPTLVRAIDAVTHWMTSHDDVLRLVPAEARLPVGFRLSAKALAELVSCAMDDGITAAQINDARRRALA